MIHVVGIRHLSPAGAVHLASVLERVQPTAVVVEAPHGVEDQMVHLVHPETKPPVALLAFTRAKPVRTILYPLASYSPEWTACRWAIEHKRTLAFMDLPAEVFLGLQLEREQAAPETPQSERALPLLEEVAQQCGGPDLETWWERTFEHTLDERVYVQAAFALGEGMREVERRTPFWERETALREAFMRRRLAEVIAQGHAPEKIVAVCGAFHAPVLTGNEPAMTDAEVAALPRLDSVVTLMPYSYQRLNQRSGYGAGNHAPSYFQALHAELEAGHPERLSARFLSRVARGLRKKGLHRSSAQVIDGVRLAHGLAAMAESPAVTLRDLRDAAVTCLGAGDAPPVLEALDEVETGNAIGRLPPGVSRTALQDDFRYQVARLELEKYLTEKPQKLDLDLREDRYVKSRESALLDRNRSIFLHRLLAVDVPLADEDKKPRDAGLTSWKERWEVRWTPETEVKLAELSLVGDSVAGAASYVLSERLGKSTGAGDAAAVLETAASCQLADALENARARVQEAAVQDHAFPSIASAVGSLLGVARFGGVRAVDPTPLWPLLDQLFLRGCLLLPTAILCDDSVREPMSKGMVTLSTAAAQEPGRVTVPELERAYRQIALGDEGHPFLVGLATSLLLERGTLSEPELAALVSRRLSAGEDVDRAGGFFEGLVAHNRMALFARRAVWESLSRFVDALDGPGLLRALVPLRRAFSGFEPGEVRRVVSALADVWGGGKKELAKAVETKLSADEAAALNQTLGGLDDLDLE